MENEILLIICIHLASQHLYELEIEKNMLWEQVHVVNLAG